ncbi:MAG TPA: hypothetical protein VK212_11055 [Lentimicrobium sp.]|nr:hypothetical protein [Lentimicrobium sp.]
MRLLFTTISLFLTITTVAQSRFEKGYYIDNSGNVNECLLKINNKSKNPNGIHFRTLEGKKEFLIIDSIAEFGIEGKFQYKRENVLIDRSSEDVDAVSLIPEPEFKKEQLFLKTLVDGKADLYVYKDINLTRFFFRSDSTKKVKQLVYKYFKSYSGSLLTNTNYLEQLKQEVKCRNNEPLDINIEYKEKPLVKYFEEYSKCEEIDPIVYKSNQSHFFHVSVKPGYRFSRLKAKRYLEDEYFINESKPSLCFGIETEIGIAKGISSVWSIIFEPTWQTFALITEVKNNEWNINYRSIELPFGVRYAYKIKPKTALLINLLYLYDISNSKILVQDVPLFTISSLPNFVAGVGFKKKYFGCEVRYSFKRDLLMSAPYTKIPFTSLSIILGYTLPWIGKE